MMNDSQSAEFREMAEIVNKAVFSVYESQNNKALLSVRVDKLKSGSVVADMSLSYNVTTGSALFKPLTDAIAKGNVGGLPISAKQSVVDGCQYISCKENQHCRFYSNMSFPECVCNKGYYSSTDGKSCLLDCTPGYCMNGGACERNLKGRTCRCPVNYKGDRCQTKDEESHVGLIVGVVIGVIVFIIFLLYCLKRQAQRGARDWKEKPLTNDVEVTGHRMENMHSSSPVVVHINNKTEEENKETTEISIGIENKGADLEDGLKKTSSLTVHLKPAPPSPTVSHSDDQSKLIKDGDEEKLSRKSSSSSSSSSSSEEELKS